MFPADQCEHRFIQDDCPFCRPEMTPSEVSASIARNTQQIIDEAMSGAYQAAPGCSRCADSDRLAAEQKARLEAVVGCALDDDGDDPPLPDFDSIPSETLEAMFSPCPYCGVTPADELTAEHSDHDRSWCAMRVESSNAMDLLRLLVERDPYTTDSWGNRWCAHCGEPPNKPHDPTCPWMRGKSMVTP